MACKKVSALKFVGTVSVGLLTGASYTLTTITAPALLTLPSAATASRALTALTTTASTHLTTLSALSTSAFALAYALSPQPSRHPYLLYTSLLSALTALAPSLSPLVLGTTPRPAQPRPASPKKKVRAMEASYEVLGDPPSESTSVSGEADEDASSREAQNGEEVSAEVADFVRGRIVQTGLAAAGFAISVVGIWGDGVQRVLQSEAVLFGV